MQSQKQQNDLSLIPKQTTQYHSNPSLYHTFDIEQAETDQFYEDLNHHVKLTSKKLSFSSYGIGMQK